MKLAQLLGLQGPRWHQVCRDTDCLSHWSYGPIGLFPSLRKLGIRRPVWLVFLCSSAHSGTQRAPLPGALLCCSVHQAHRGYHLDSSCFVDWPVRHLRRHRGWVLLCNSVSQALDGPVFLLSSCQCCQCWSVGRERLQ